MNTAILRMARRRAVRSLVSVTRRPPRKDSPMPTFMIEREIPGASQLTHDELRGITTKSNETVDGPGAPVRVAPQLRRRRQGLLHPRGRERRDRPRARPQGRLPGEPRRRGLRVLRPHRPARAAGLLKSPRADRPRARVGNGFVPHSMKPRPGAAGCCCSPARPEWARRGSPRRRSRAATRAWCAAPPRPPGRPTARSSARSASTCARSRAGSTAAGRCAPTSPRSSPSSARRARTATAPR